MEKERLARYLVAGPQDYAQLTLAEFTERIVTLMQAGITLYQFRDKGYTYQNADERLQLVQKLVHLGQQFNVPVIINDDLDLALTVQAAGVHVGQDDLAIEQVLRHKSANFWVGLSVRNLTEMKAAQALAVDYLGVGPLMPTQTKVDAAPALGLRRLKTLLEHNHHATVGIGGIKLSDLKSLAQSGLDGVAVVSLLTQAPDPVAMVQAMRKSWQTNAK
ncbi:hypothetical protein IV73_GL000547 [Weissella kandleri]|uniref:Thiamine-phosphate synthase n=1 Tax=Weissella kandleri TaxID=1616 RepID=A0A0R2JHP7_9LACO|nr:thiamine phosphate synthase [Weissella kandleri]KRN75382.1 hypothetical protein IV73_GL000547 [Weissella kandleri]